MELNELVLRPIGVIRTPFTDRYKAPRQPGAERASAEGTIVLFPGKNFEQALFDLSGFEKIWILFWFHRNASWKPKVLPPRGGKKRGVFATRSPHRPNPIGLSLATLLEIKGRTLRVADTDLLDGTPILDLKPYLPYAEAFPNARAGWLEDVIAAEKLAEKGTPFSVTWSVRARKQMEWLQREHAVELEDMAERVLTRDAEPHSYRRISATQDGMQLAIKSWRILFSVAGKRVKIQRVASGYAAAALAAGKANHDGAAHVGFHAKWPEKS